MDEVFWRQPWMFIISVHTSRNEPLYGGRTFIRPWVWLTQFVCFFPQIHVPFCVTRMFKTFEKGRWVCFSRCQNVTRRLCLHSLELHGEQQQQVLVDSYRPPMWNWGQSKKRTQTPFFMRLTCGRPWTFQAVQKLGQHSVVSFFFEGQAGCNQLCISTVKSYSPKSPDLPCEAIAVRQWVSGFPSTYSDNQWATASSCAKGCLKKVKKKTGSGNRRFLCAKKKKIASKISLCCDLQDFDGQWGDCNKDLMTVCVPIGNLEMLKIFVQFSGMHWHFIQSPSSLASPAS